MTRFATILCLMLVTSVPVAAQSSPSPSAILVVDQQRVFDNCRACKAATDALNEQVEVVTARLEKEQRELNARMETAKRAVDATGQLPEAEREAAFRQLAPELDALQYILRKLDEKKQWHQERLEALRADIDNQFKSGFFPIIEKIREERGAIVVIDKTSVLALAPMTDITVEALARLDNDLPAITMPPPSAD